MEIKFNVTKEERKALVQAIGEIVGWAPVYKGAPSFAFAVSNYVIDRYGTLTYDERTEADDVSRLLLGLAAKGFTHESEILPLPSGDSGVQAGDGPEAIMQEAQKPADEPESFSREKKTIVVGMPLFDDSALDNLKKLIAGKASLIKKSIGADDLSLDVSGGAIHFRWFDQDSTEQELAAYEQFVTALCRTAKTQKRVTMKEAAVDSEKFAFRCFLLRLGFIGTEFASARKVLLAKLPGSGSFKSGDGKDRSKRDLGCVAGGNGTDTVVPKLCAECRHHCYYTDGLLQTSGGGIVDTSKRAPDKYTHYCLNTPRGFRKIKHASEWSGGETPPPWCRLRSAGADEMRQIANGGACDE